MTSNRPGARATQRDLPGGKKSWASAAETTSSSKDAFSSGSMATVDMLSRAYRRLVPGILTWYSFRDQDLADLAQPAEMVGRDALVRHDQVAILDAAESIGRLGPDLAA